MGKGTKRYTFRLPDDLVVEIVRQLASLRRRSPHPPADLTDVVRRALADWLAKYRRSAAPGSGRKGRSAAGKGPGPSPAEDAAAFEVSDTPAAGQERRAEVA
jgi:Arc/MetJ-type ribon-helix-helix transcriptional regulator